MYIYESHNGGVYFTDYEQDYDELYCEICGDSDTFLGEADSFLEAWELLEEKVSVFGRGGFSLQYIYPALCEEFSTDAENAGEACPEVDLDGFCRLKDSEILEKVRKITGKEFRFFTCTCRDGGAIVMASDEADAKRVLREECMCFCDGNRDCENPVPAEITLEKIADEWSY